MAKIQSESQTQSLTQAFRALGDTTRMRIVRLLADNPGICVGELASELEMTDSAVSQHCRILRTAGLIRPKREGLRKCYQLQGENPDLQAILEVALSQTKKQEE